VDTQTTNTGGVSRPVLPKSYARHIEAQQQLVKEGKFSLEDVPGYVRGEPPSVATWHHVNFLDLYPKIWGREFGANGIGKLREVALTEITSHERWPWFEEAPQFVHDMGLPYSELDTEKMRDQSLQYQAALEEAGVFVHRLAYPDPPVGIYGPTRGMWATNEVLVVRGGTIIPGMAVSPYGLGRAEYIALWAMSELGIPPLLAITGKGVAEAGPCFWLAEDVFVAAKGLAFNEEGLKQLIPAVRRTSLVDEKDFTALIIDCPGGKYFDRQSGVSHHPDIVLGPLDVDKVIAYTSGLDFDTWSWLKDHNYTIVEVERDEHVMWAPANVTILEPGRVVMCAEAENTIAAVRKAGVDVVPVPYSEFIRSGGGLHCSTMRIWRDKGPYSTDR
jgi:N-dimethylarginine dimethylaminohydrolase